MPFNKFWNLAPDSETPGVLNMYIYGQICAASSFFGSQDDVVASRFVEDLNAYPGIQTINVYINSPGGSVFAAASIINQLRKHPACVHTWCDGICASAAVGILMAADPDCRHMSRATLLMVHNPSSQVQGDQTAFLKAADLLAKVKKTLLCIYQEGTGLPEDQLATMMDDCTYLNADEALAYNFVDDITEDNVTYDFRNENTLVCNGLTLDVAASLDMTELQKHLTALASTAKSQLTILDKGGSIMTFEEFMASLTEDHRSLVKNAIKDQLAEAVRSATDTLTGTLNTAHQEALTALQSTNETLTQKVTDLQGQLEATTKQTSPEDAIVAQLPPEAQALLAQARADALTNKLALEQLQEAKAFAEFKETFNVFSHLPLQEEHIKAMQNLSNADENMYNSLRELLKVADNALAAGFTATGSDTGTNVPTDAYSQIEQKITAFCEAHEGAKYSDALRAVLKENPSLYSSYRDSMYGNQ